MVRQLLESNDVTRIDRIINLKLRTDMHDSFIYVVS